MELVRKSLYKVVHKRPQEEDDKVPPIPDYENSWPHGLNWTADEEAIRSGVLFFRVKFYGTAQLAMSHGRKVCEETLLEIKSAGNKIRALLFIDLHSLRLVDEKTRSLIFDVKIFKLMFSADASSLPNGFTFVTKEAERFYRCYAFASRDSTGFRLASAIAGSYCIGWSSRDDNNNNLIELSASKRPVPLKPPREYTWVPLEEARSEVTDKEPDEVTQEPLPKSPKSPQKPGGMVATKRRTFRQSSLMTFPKIPSLKALRRQTSLNPEILRDPNDKKQKFDWILTDLNTREASNNLSNVTEVQHEKSTVSQKKNLLDASLVLNDMLPSPTDLKSQMIPVLQMAGVVESIVQSPDPIKVEAQVSEIIEMKLPVVPPPRPPRPPRLERQAPVADSLCLPQVEERPVTPLSPSNPFFDSKLSGKVDSDPWKPLDNSSANKVSRTNAELNEDSQFSDFFDDFNPSMSFDFEDFRVESVLRVSSGNKTELTELEAPESLRRSRLLCDPFGEEWAAKVQSEISGSSDYNNPFNET